MADVRTTGVLDLFNRAAEDPLSGGGNWSGVAGSNLKITSPTHVQHSTGSGLLNVQYSYWTPKQYTVTGAKEVEVWGYSGGSANFQEGWSLGLATVLSPFSGYLVRWSEEIGDNAVQIRRWASGSNTTIKDDRTFANLVPNFGGGGGNDVLVFRTHGNDLELLYSSDAGANFTLRATVTDTTYRGPFWLVLGLDGSPEWQGFGGGNEEWHPEFLRRPWNYQGKELDLP